MAARESDRGSVLYNFKTYPLPGPLPRRNIRLGRGQNVYKGVRIRVHVVWRNSPEYEGARDAVKKFACSMQLR